MKKVLFILPSLTVGGLERVQVTIANKLADNGYDVTVMTLDPKDDLKDELDNRVRYIYKPPKLHLGNKIPYIRHKLYDDGMWETRASAKQLYEHYVGNEKYDVEIAFFRGLPIKIISGSTNRGARHLAWVHSDFKRTSGYMSCFSSARCVFDAYKGMDKVVCVSDQAQESFREVIGDTGNLTTVYNMIPIEEIRRKAEDEPEIKVPKSSFHVVLVGHLLIDVKGQKRLITAVSRLRDEGRDISLALVGGGPDEKILKDLIRERRAEDYITMTGSQKNPYPYIKEADLLVCASYFEGYNLTVAEALILGVPILSTDCTGPNEILDRGKYGKIVANSEEGLYNGLRQFADDPYLLNDYKEKALERRAFFDENKLLMKITDLFDN